MNARTHEKQPNDKAAQIEEPTVIDAIASTQIEHRQNEQGDEQRLHRDVATIEKRDNDDAAYIVYHGQGRQKDTHTERDTVAQQAQHGQGESDVGGHRDGGAISGRPLMANQEVGRLGKPAIGDTTPHRASWPTSWL